MMNMLEEAIIYATVMHQGKVRKFNGIPFILHPMEVAQILSTMTDDPEIITAETWQKRKEESLLLLKNSDDNGVKMLWLADKLANMRSLARVYSEQGESIWQNLHQKDPSMHLWYYRTIAETVELTLRGFR